MYQKTAVTCPLCHNSYTFVHTYHTKPTFGSCDVCGYDRVTGYSARGMIEHRRPRLLDDPDFVAGRD